MHDRHCALRGNRCMRAAGCAGQRCELYDLFETDGAGVERQPGASFWQARGAAWFARCGWLDEQFGAHHGLPCTQPALEASADAAEGRYRARKYYEAMTVGVDRALAAVNRSLAAAGLWGDTLQIFVSDNGGKLENHQHQPPLQGGK